MDDSIVARIIASGSVYGSADRKSLKDLLGKDKLLVWSISYSGIFTEVYNLRSRISDKDLGQVFYDGECWRWIFRFGSSGKIAAPMDLQPFWENQNIPEPLLACEKLTEAYRNWLVCCVPDDEVVVETIHVEPKRWWQFWKPGMEPKDEKEKIGAVVFGEPRVI